MKVEVLKPFKARSKGEIVQHNPGEKLQIRVDKIPPLLNAGVIRLLEPLDKAKEPIAAKIHSKILNEDVWVLTHSEALAFVPDGEIYYLPEEIRYLKGGDAEEIKAVHRVKRALGGKLIAVNQREDKALV